MTKVRLLKDKSVTLLQRMFTSFSLINDSMSLSYGFALAKVYPWQLGTNDPSESIGLTNKLHAT